MTLGSKLATPGLAGGGGGGGGGGEGKGTQPIIQKPPETNPTSWSAHVLSKFVDRPVSHALETRVSDRLTNATSNDREKSLNDIVG